MAGTLWKGFPVWKRMRNVKLRLCEENKSPKYHHLLLQWNMTWYFILSAVTNSQKGLLICRNIQVYSESRTRSTFLQRQIISLSENHPLHIFIPNLGHFQLIQQNILTPPKKKQMYWTGWHQIQGRHSLHKWQSLHSAEPSLSFNPSTALLFGICRHDNNSRCYE